MNREKIREKEFLKSYIVLLRARLNSNNYASRMCWSADASWVATQKANVRGAAGADATVAAAPIKF